MNDEQKVVAAEDLAAAQADLIARIRRARGAGAAPKAEDGGRRTENRVEARPSTRPDAGLAQGVVVGTTTTDVDALLARKDADLGDVEAALNHLRKVFENFQKGTGFLPRQLRDVVNEFEGDFLVKFRVVRQRVAEARKMARE